jgi:hypothetical protein
VTFIWDSNGVGELSVILETVITVLPGILRHKGDACGLSGTGVIFKQVRYRHKYTRISAGVINSIQSTCFFYVKNYA